MNTKFIGNLGENIAARYLINSGYSIIERNHKEGFDEIDMIGKSAEGDLIFFEVKTVTHSLGSDRKPFLEGFMPEDHLTRQKLARIIRACQKFIARNQYLINEEKGWQIDLIAILIKDGRKYDLHHYKNI
jgi:putative endonuclease